MKRFFKFAFVALAVVVSATVNVQAKGAKKGATTLAVVVDEKTYATIPQAVDAYVESVNNSYRKGVLVVDKWFNPDSIKAELYAMYTQQNLEGAVFIGDIPIPMLRDAQHFTTAFKMNQSMKIQRSSVPSDRFYDDFDLNFKFIKQDEENKLFFYYSLLAEGSQEIVCDIYSSRIKAPEGENKYELVAAYLNKAVAASKNRIAMDKMFHFGGHGYNSESFNARIDEAVAFHEQFQFLNNRKGDLNYIDHSFDDFVKHRLMGAVADKDLDLAVLHHHGADDTQYLNGSPFVADPQGWVKLARNYFRSKMRSAKDKEKTKARFMEQFDIPASWCDDAFTPERELEDSLYAANMDIFITDLNGYESGAQMVILDACYNGSFNMDDYIAARYIFNPGNTIVVKANSVNTLQDTWTTELLGLLNWGVCAGNWAKGQMTLESHLFGDPTFEFGSQDIPAYFNNKGFNPNEAIIAKKNDVKYWRSVLYAPVADELACDYKSLAIQMLYNNNAITSQELLDIQKNSNSRVLRLEAFNTNRKIADANFPKAIIMGLSDDYELTQRLSAMYVGKNFSDELIPAVVKTYMSPVTSARVSFQLKGNLKGFNVEKLIAEFEKENKANPYWAGQESFGKLIKMINSYEKSYNEEIAAVKDGSMNFKDLRSFARGRRNGCEPKLVESLLHIINTREEAELRLIAIEALGWYQYSSVKDEVIAHCEALYAKESDEAAKAELLKTLNRLK